MLMMFLVVARHLQIKLQCTLKFRAYWAYTERIFCDDTRYSDWPELLDASKPAARCSVSVCSPAIYGGIMDSWRVAKPAAAESQRARAIPT